MKARYHDPSPWDCARMAERRPAQVRWERAAWLLGRAKPLRFAGIGLRPAEILRPLALSDFARSPPAAWSSDPVRPVAANRFRPPSGKVPRAASRTSGRGGPGRLRQAQSARSSTDGSYHGRFAQPFACIPAASDRAETATSVAAATSGSRPSETRIPPARRSHSHPGI